MSIYEDLQPISLAGVSTYPLASRPSKVTVRDFAAPYPRTVRGRPAAIERAALRVRRDEPNGRKRAPITAKPQPTKLSRRARKSR